MKLADLLQYTAAEYLDDRTEIIDGDPDALWSDSFLVRQFNEAQRQLARAAFCIKDVGNQTAGTVVLKTGISLYNLHQSVLRVYDVTPIDQTWPLSHNTDLSLRVPHPYGDGYFFFDVNDISVSSPGRPLSYSTDAGTRLMRVFRTPSATENGLQLILRIARLPINWLTLDDVNAEPEIPEDYHYALATFAAGKALTQPNVDGQQKADGRALLAEFQERLAEARQDRQRAEMTPNNWAFGSSTALIK
ncbi:MAG: phage adaptor protein [Acidobacteriaceae bacterium]